MMGSAAEERVTVPGFRVPVWQVGTDVPVLLLHQALGSAEMYSDARLGNVSEWLAARGCRVISYDLPGHGCSDSFDEFPDDFIDQAAVDALDLLDALGLDEAAAVIGVGFGGLVALRLAAMLPLRVRCAVADSPPLLEPWVPFEPWPGLPPAKQDQARRLPERWERYARSLSATDPLRTLAGALQCPAMVLVPADNPGPEASRLQAAARALSARLTLVPADGPPTCWRAPGFFVREVEGFLASYA
jgi:pimeloyl-ACP methyl ester carboxylesterase